MSARRPLTPLERKPQTEKQEQAAIVDLLHSIGSQVYVLGTKRRRGDYQGTMQTPGIPDLFAFLPVKPHRPACVWIEAKRKGGRASQPQLDFKHACFARDIHHVLGGHDAVAEWLKYWNFLR